MSPVPLPVQGFNVVDWTPTSTTVTNVDGSPFIDNVVVSTGLRGPAGVVVINADQEFPPDGTPIGTIVFKRLT
jgi:hypothetical protein